MAKAHFFYNVIFSYLNFNVRVKFYLGKNIFNLALKFNNDQNKLKLFYLIFNLNFFCS